MTRLRKRPTPTPAEELTDDQLNTVAGGLLPAVRTQNNLANSMKVTQRAVVSSVGGLPDANNLNNLTPE